MKIYLYNCREHIYESFKWLLEKCGYNWCTLEIDQDNDDEYHELINNVTWKYLNRHDAKSWEIIIKNHKLPPYELKSYGSYDCCLVHIWVPDDKALLFKLRWS